MKAFTIYSKQEIDLRKLLNKLKLVGKINCDFETFSSIYNKWHMKTFPGCKINTMAGYFRDDWFSDFVNYIANYEV